MKRVHYIDNYLLNPQHPVTVNLIGAGGTGSQVLTCLARLDIAGTRTSGIVRNTL
jgi:ABC-type proline/glycine betaine transport system permease subunit